MTCGVITASPQFFQKPMGSVGAAPRKRGSDRAAFLQRSGQLAPGGGGPPQRILAGCIFFQGLWAAGDHDLLRDLI
jgi:hypothetical protein